MNIEKVLQNLKARGFNAYYVENATDAEKLIMDLVPKNESTGFGGSATLKALDIPNKLKTRGNVVYHRSFFPDSERMNVMLKANHADWFITSTNALTEDGELINTDGLANRISSMVFGGANTMVVCGINKIVPNISAGLERIRTVAAKKNCERFGFDNPCVTGGDCADCPIDKTICRATTIIHHPTRLKKFHIIIVNENLGY